MNHHAGLGDLLQPGLALEDDQRTMALRGEGGCGPRHLRGDVFRLPLFSRRDQPREGSDATDAFEATAELWLEDDDEREDAHDGARLQDLA